MKKIIWLLSSLIWVGLMSGYDCQVCIKHMVKTSDFDTEYVINRLNPHIDALIQFSKTNKKMNPGFNSRFSVISEGVPSAEFTHELIKLCAKQMEQYGSLDPLFETWRLFKQTFKNVDPHIFLREMAVMIFAIYRNVLVQALERTPTRVTLEEVNDLHQRISMLPIHELLDALDKCYEQFTLILQDYGPKDLDWVTWIQNNWWVPPVSAASLIYSLFKNGMVLSYDMIKNVKQQL